MLKKYFFRVFFVLLLSSNIFADIQENIKLDDKLDKIENSISKIRRDQLNYSIEKDLLKETFSSNYQTINIVLTIILGVFSIIGFLGIRDISEIKKQYEKELVKVNTISSDLELKIKQISKEQEKVKEDYSKIISTNDEQNIRIKVLELQEKIASFINANNYQRGMEYITIALELDPSNTILLEQKAISLWRLNDLEAAILLYKDLLNSNPNDNLILNLCELFLLTKKTTEFKELYNKYKTIVDSQYEKKISTYFQLLLHYQENKGDEMQRLIIEFLSSKKIHEIPMRNSAWVFDDARKILKKEPNSKAKTHITNFIELLKGNLNQEIIGQYIDVETET